MSIFYRNKKVCTAVKKNQKLVRLFWGQRSKVTYQLVSLIVVEQQRLFERPSDVRVRGGALEVGGSKLGKLVLQ